MKNLIYSPFLGEKSASKKIAYIALFTAISTVSNMILEARIFDVQFSLTITVSFLSGIFLGPVFGFCSGFLSDFIGYAVNSWGQLYMPWVGISTGGFAAISGLLFLKKSEKSSAAYIKAIIFSVSSLLICTVAINSTGFYFWNKLSGFQKAFYDFVESITGKAYGSYFFYVIYRLFFKGQIFNSLANYVLIFLLLPLLKKLPATKNLI